MQEHSPFLALADDGEYNLAMLKKAPDLDQPEAICPPEQVIDILDVDFEVPDLDDATIERIPDGPTDSALKQLAGEYVDRFRQAYPDIPIVSNEPTDDAEVERLLMGFNADDADIIILKGLGECARLYYRRFQELCDQYVGLTNDAAIAAFLTSLSDGSPRPAYCVDVSIHGVQTEMRRGFYHESEHGPCPPRKISVPQKADVPPASIQQEELRRRKKKEEAHEASQNRERKLKRRGWIR